MNKYFFIKENNYYGDYKVCQAELSPEQIECENDGFLWAKKGVLELWRVRLHQTEIDAEMSLISSLCN